MGLLDTIRAAIADPAIVAALADEPDAGASITETTVENTTMSTETGISEADHKAAVAKAEAEGKLAGRKEAADRMAAILGTDGIKGDAGRMSAAFDLATKSPDMAAADVVAFVSGNLPAASASTSTYEAERLSAAAGLTAPGGKPQQQAAAVQAGWAKAFKTG